MVSTANSDSIPAHPKGTQARVLLSSVFGPYARDDEFGSRSINPMELYHNQVTREQGSFSLRMFHRSWGLMMIQRNISAPSTLLDFPTLERFERELTSTEYDIVGISGIIPNFGKVREMCRRVRQLSPKSTIIVGGHVAAIPGLDKLIDADYIVRGEGIAWMRRYLGEDPAAPIEHPEILSGFGMRVYSACAFPTTRVTPPRPSFRRSDVRWDATSAPPRRSSAARARASTSTNRETSCSKSWSIWSTR